MADVLCLGEALIGFVADNSEKTLIEVIAFNKVAGGATANVSVGASKLGRISVFLGRVGDDEFSYFLRNTIKRNDVDVSQMQLISKQGLAWPLFPFLLPTPESFCFTETPVTI